MFSDGTIAVPPACTLHLATPPARTGFALRAQGTKLMTAAMTVA